MDKTTMSVQELSAQMGISLPKAYELVKKGLSHYQGRNKDSYSCGSFQGMASHNFQQGRMTASKNIEERRKAEMPDINEFTFWKAACAQNPKNCILHE